MQRKSEEKWQKKGTEKGDRLLFFLKELGMVFFVGA